MFSINLRITPASGPLEKIELLGMILNYLSLFLQTHERLIDSQKKSTANFFAGLEPNAHKKHGRSSEVWTKYICCQQESEILFLTTDHLIWYAPTLSKYTSSFLVSFWIEKLNFFFQTIKLLEQQDFFSKQSFLVEIKHFWTKCINYSCHFDKTIESDGIPISAMERRNVITVQEMYLNEMIINDKGEKLLSENWRQR